MIEITDIDDPRISQYRSLRCTPASHTEDKLFIAEGEKVTLKVLKSGLIIESVFATPEFFQEYEQLIQKKKIVENRIFISDKKIMEQIVGFKIHAGIMAMCRQPVDVPVEKMNSPVIVLNGLTDSENVGSIIRNAAAFGIDSIIADENSSSPYLRRSVRVSMGNVIDMKIHHSENIIKTLQDLKVNSGYNIISAEITDDSKPINNFIFPEKYCLVFGNEAHGVSKEILEISDNIVHIPINPEVSSINVAASSAVFMYHHKNFIR